MTMPVVRSVQIGLPRQYGEDGASDPMNRLWTTGSYKEPVVGPVRVGT